MHHHPSVGVDLIGQERLRQVEVEGWTAAHDDAHKPGTLTIAAVCYATIAGAGPNIRATLRSITPVYWPWDPSWWKPGKDDSNQSRILELKKAGALIAAEIERLSRQTTHS